MPQPDRALPAAQSLFELPHPKASALASSGVPIFLAFNPVEYHGPHLSLRNDALVCAGLTADLHLRLVAGHPEWEPLVGESLELGAGPVPGPGSQATPFPELRARVLQACRSLLALGARRVVLMTFHGDPLHNLALADGVDLLRRAGVAALAPMCLLFRQFVAPQLERLEPALARLPRAEDRETARRVIGRDYHAGFCETSLTLHYAPQSVSPDLRDVPPCPPIRPRRALLAAAAAARRLGRESLAGELAFAAWGQGWYALRPFPGYTGVPALADAGVGEELACMAAGDLAEATLAVFDEGAEPPAPILPWLRQATLGGRIAL